MVDLKTDMVCLNSGMLSASEWGQVLGALCLGCMGPVYGHLGSQVGVQCTSSSREGGGHVSQLLPVASWVLAAS